MCTRPKFIIAVVIIAVICLYAGDIKQALEDFHHRVDSALGIHEDEHKGSK